MRARLVRIEWSELNGMYRLVGGVLLCVGGGAVTQLVTVRLSLIFFRSPT